MIIFASPASAHYLFCLFSQCIMDMHKVVARDVSVWFLCPKVIRFWPECPNLFVETATAGNDPQFSFVYFYFFLRLIASLCTNKICVKYQLLTTSSILKKEFHQRPFLFHFILNAIFDRCSIYIYLYIWICANCNCKCEVFAIWKYD